MISNYDPVHGRVPITDDMISSAKPFKGWCEEFLNWATPDRPCEDPDKNAYHIKWLAQCMQEEHSWIGKPLVLYYMSASVFDGSHRLRGAQYLKSKGIDIIIPVRYADIWVK
jgi:hypothetical protein